MQDDSRYTRTVGGGNLSRQISASLYQPSNLDNFFRSREEANLDVRFENDEEWQKLWVVFDNVQSGILKFSKNREDYENKVFLLEMSMDKVESARTDTSIGAIIIKVARCRVHKITLRTDSKVQLQDWLFTLHKSVILVMSSIMSQNTPMPPPRKPDLRPLVEDKSKPTLLSSSKKYMRTMDDETDDFECSDECSPKMSDRFGGNHQHHSRRHSFNSRLSTTVPAQSAFAVAMSPAIPISNVVSSSYVVQMPSPGQQRSSAGRSDSSSSASNSQKIEKLAGSYVEINAASSVLEIAMLSLSMPGGVCSLSAAVQADHALHEDDYEQDSEDGHEGNDMMFDLEESGGHARTERSKPPIKKPTSSLSSMMAAEELRKPHPFSIVSTLSSVSSVSASSALFASISQSNTLGTAGQSLLGASLQRAGLISSSVSSSRSSGVRVMSRRVVDWVVADCSLKGKRNCNEDRVDVFRDLFENGAEVENEKYGYCGVYDGHNGDQAACYLKTELLKSICSHDLFETDLQKAITDTCVAIDKTFLVECRTANRNWGTTALGAFIHRGPDEDNQAGPIQLIVFNIGDCHAVLCSNGIAVDLSSPHKPSRPDEQKRVEAAGGWLTTERELHLQRLHEMDFSNPWIREKAKEVNWQVIERVCGEIAVTRSIGDYVYKNIAPGVKLDPYEFNWPENHSQCFLGELLIPHPEFQTARLSGQDEFFVIASDGLWDVLSNTDVVTVVRAAFREGKSLQEAVEQLCDLAIKLGSADNVSAVIVKFIYSEESDDF